MDIKIIPSPLVGEVNIPPSKSAAHRALICASLAEGTSRVEPYCTSKDIKATAACLRCLGMKIEEDEKGYTVGRGETQKSQTLNFNESGSTARFLLPVAAALGADITAVGEGRLPERPMKVLCDLFRQHGVEAASDNLPITLSGKMTSGEFALPGKISSQYISGLMLAAPLLDGDTEIIPTTALESVGYIDMTIDAMKHQGVLVEETTKGWKISAEERYKPRDIKIEGDWSQAAFFMSAAALGGEVALSGLNFASTQGDMAALDVFAAFGAEISIVSDTLFVKKGKELRGITVCAEQIPDMVPAIAATAAFAKGETKITGAARLRLKESDRIATVCAALKAMGVGVTEGEDSITIVGGKAFGGKIDGANDHRIVMAFSVAAAYCEGETEITCSQAVTKSYPEFFRDFTKIGGKVNEF